LGGEVVGPGQPTLVTLAAWGPFWPSTISNSDDVSFLKAAVAFASDGSVMDKDIRAVIPADETVTLGVVEPLNTSLHG